MPLFNPQGCCPLLQPACPLLSSRGHVGFQSCPRDLQVSRGCCPPGAQPGHVRAPWKVERPCSRSRGACAPAPAPEASDPWGRECLQPLQRLHRSSRQLWDVTEESLRSLRERLRRPEAVGLESLLLLHSADRVLQVHLE